MTHPCFHDARDLADHLTAKTDRTPTEECALHILAEQQDALDQFVSLADKWGRADRRFKQLVTTALADRDNRTRIERAQHDAHTASLRHINAELRRRLTARQDADSEDERHLTVVTGTPNQ